MTALATHLVRTAGGSVVHHDDCAVAKQPTTVAIPWVWAEGRPLSEVREAVAMVGASTCRQCHPFDRQDHDAPADD